MNRMTIGESPSMFRFEKLEVWIKSIELTDLICQFVDDLPSDNKCAFSDRLYSAVVSIPVNIAAASGRTTNADLAHFVSEAYGSLMETVALLEVMRRRDLMSLVVSARLVAVCEEVARMLDELNPSH